MQNKDRLLLATIAALTAFTALVCYTANSVGAQKNRLLLSATEAGNYLVRMQLQDGSFHYVYNPADDVIDDTQYNMLRQSGVTYSLYQLYAATHDNAYLQAADLATDYIKAFLVAEPKGALSLDNTNRNEGDPAKLGGAGLSLLAMTYSITAGNKADLPTARALAQYIVSLQHTNGFYEGSNDSLYYPGEAMLGLMKLYSIDPDKRWLDSASKGATYLIGEQKKAEQLPPDAWFTQALEALYLVKPDKLFYDHAIALGNNLVDLQYHLDNAHLPIFNPNPAQAAARAEGILAAWRLARAAKDRNADKLGEAVRLTSLYLQNAQYNGSESFPKPWMALGGIPVQEDDRPTLRMDYNQHAISTFLEYGDIIYDK